MKATTNQAGPFPVDLMATISATIRHVSAGAPATAIAADSRLVEDLALDSLDLLALILRLEDHFQIEFDPTEIHTIRTVGDLAAGLSNHPRRGPCPWQPPCIPGDKGTHRST